MKTIYWAILGIGVLVVYKYTTRAKTPVTTNQPSSMPSPPPSSSSSNSGVWGQLLGTMESGFDLLSGLLEATADERAQDSPSGGEWNY